jgi:predicted aldo/keto reductase-like oxidoreductase
MTFIIFDETIDKFAQGLNGMIYRQYGDTGIEVSAIGFGGMRFENYDDRDACAELVKSCYDAGINYFDTACGYAGGKSEEVMGLAFREMQKTRAEKPFYVSTKSGSGLPGDVRKDLEGSLQRLQVDCIDFYHVWYVNSLANLENRKKAGVLRAFEKAKEEGLVKHICVSSHMPGDYIGQALRDYPFAGALLGYSAMNFSYREAAVQAASDLGRGVVVMNPLGGGLIPNHPERFSFVKTSPDETVVEAALRFLLNDERITVALVGMSKQEHLREAISAVEGFKPVPADEIKRIKRSLKQAFVELCTCCGYCNRCPHGIPVSKFMEAYNYKKLKGSRQDMINRLRWHWGITPETAGLEKCVECGLCENACTQRLPIVSRLGEIAEDLRNFIQAQKA